LTTQNGKHTQAVYLADCDGHPRVHTPFIVGLFNYLERHMPSVGYFNPIAAQDRDGSVDLHVDLIHKTFGLKHDMRSMYAVTEADATKVSGRDEQLAHPKWPAGHPSSACSSPFAQPEAVVSHHVRTIKLSSITRSLLSSLFATTGAT
jgi:hypothetical protein